MDQDDGTFKGATRELTLDRVAQATKLGRHNLLSTKRLTTAFDAPMRVYPTAATIRPRFDRKTLVFRSLRPETGLLEIKARRRADMKKPLTPLTTGRAIVTARANLRHIMEFHRLLGDPSEEITRGTARMSGVPVTGTWSPCVQCSESRVRRYAVPKLTESRTNERAERCFIDITGPFMSLLSAATGTLRCAWTTSPASNSFASSSIKATPRKSFVNSSRNTSPPQASRSAPSAPTVEESSKATSNRSWRSWGSSARRPLRIYLNTMASWSGRLDSYKTRPWPFYEV